MTPFKRRWERRNFSRNNAQSTKLNFAEREHCRSDRIFTADGTEIFADGNSKSLAATIAPVSPRNWRLGPICEGLTERFDGGGVLKIFLALTDFNRGCSARICGRSFLQTLLPCTG